MKIFFDDSSSTNKSEIQNLCLLLKGKPFQLFLNSFFKKMNFWEDFLCVCLARRDNFWEAHAPTRSGSRKPAELHRRRELRRV
jgi:hypothetical protein